jgi:hypothetical protein
MSYEKRTQVSPLPNLIRFYYLVDTIAGKVEKISSYKAAGTVKDNGQADFDRIQLSIDEKDLMKDYMRTAMLQIFDLLFHVIAGDSVVHNTGVRLTTAATVNATAMIVGQGYEIKTVGSPATDYTLCGAADSVVGTSFICTLAGTNAGTVYPADFGSYVDLKDNAKYRTINLDVIDKTIEDAIIDYILGKWYVLKGSENDANIHFTEYKKSLADISKRSITLRQY